MTKALLHGEGTLTVSVRVGAGLRVQVTDDGRATPLPGRDHPDEEEGGGLFIMDALASRWGVIPKTIGSGTSVWFESREEPRAARQQGHVAGRSPFDTA